MFLEHIVNGVGLHCFGGGGDDFVGDGEEEQRWWKKGVGGGGRWVCVCVEFEGVWEGLGLCFKGS